MEKARELICIPTNLVGVSYFSFEALHKIFQNCQKQNTTQKYFCRL